MRRMRNRQRRRAPRRIASLLGSVALASLAARATAAAEGLEPAAPLAVAVELPDCSELPYDAAELTGSLALELGQRGLTLADAAADPSTTPAARLALSSCDAGAESIALRVTDANGALVLVQRAALESAPFVARARTLALWIAESIESHRGQLLADSRPGVVVAEVRQPLRGLAEPAGAGAEPSLHIGLALHARSPLRSFAGFWGVEASLGAPLWGDLHGSVEGAVAAHTSRTPLGQLHVTWVSASVGLDLVERGALSASVGPRLTLAHVAANGENRLGVSSVTQSENLVLLGGRASLGIRLGDRFALTAALDAGRAPRGLVVTAGGQPDLWLDGWIAGAGLGVRYDL
jgi:hypothetical protein